MPLYNAASTVEAALQSVQSQTVEDWELIVWDDASTDQGLALLEVMDEPRLVLLAGKCNAGPGLARNGAMERARGQWITLIDADDCWDPRRLEILLNAAEGRDDTLIFDDIMTCHDGPDRRLVPWRRVHGEHAFGGSGKSARNVSLSAFIRSERLLIQPLFPARYVHTNGIWQSSRQFAEDAEFVFRLAAAGVQLRYVPEPLYFYRITPDSTTARASDVTLMRKCIQDVLEMADWPQETRIAFADKIHSLHRNEALYLLYRALRSRAPREALRLLLSTPGVLAILPRRVVLVLYYHIHRLIHGGAMR